MNNEQAKSSARSDDEACGKLWEIYLKEATEYDKGLVRSWKEDMDVILVFSGLYSAVLTAFVIESYRNLQADPAETSVILLKRISEQLASPGQNVTSLTPIPNHAAFAPTRAALACNVFWSISLGLTLSSAFLATILLPTTRRFLHRISVGHSASAQAHILQFLYFGIKDFRMHTLVDTVPSLLHLSLGSFFAGLVAYLHDVNHLLSWLFVGVLIAAIACYSALTVLPTISLSSPYATPFSPLLWLGWRHLRNTLASASHRIHHVSDSLDKLSKRLLRTSINPPAVDAEASLLPDVSNVSVEKDSPDIDHLTTAVMAASRLRLLRQEAASITWVYRSLREDKDVLDFIEAFLDPLMDTNDFRSQNFHLIRPLLLTEDPKLDIMAGTFRLMKNAENPRYDKGYRKRCALACSRFIYVISRLMIERRGELNLTSHLDTRSLSTSNSTPQILQMLQKHDDYRALDTAKSASALFALSICLIHREGLPNGMISLSLLEGLKNTLGIELAVMGVESEPWSNSEDNITIDSQVSVKSVISYFFCEYLVKSLQGLSPDFAIVCKLFTSNGGVPYHQFGHTGNDWVNDLMSQHANPPPSPANAVFGLLFDHAPNKDANWIIDYISESVGAAGWGSTVGWTVWDDTRRSKLFHIMQNLPDSVLFGASGITALQEVVLMANLSIGEVSETVAPAFSTVSASRRHISIIISFMSLTYSDYPIPALNDIHTNTIDALDSDPYLEETETIEEHWRLLLQTLHDESKSLSPRHTRDILQYFQSYSYYSPPLLYDCSSFHTKLVHQTSRFGALWLANPSMDLLDINAMLWGIWNRIIEDTGHDDEDSNSTTNSDIDTERFNTWPTILPLLDVATKHLNPTNKKTVNSVLESSTARERYIIPDCQNFIPDFVKNVEKVQAWILRWKESPSLASVVTALPPADAAEELFFGSQSSDLDSEIAHESGDNFLSMIASYTLSRRLCQSACTTSPCPCQ